MPPCVRLVAHFPVFARKERKVFLRAKIRTPFLYNHHVHETHNLSLHERSHTHTHTLKHTRAHTHTHTTVMDVVWWDGWCECATSYETARKSINPKSHQVNLIHGPSWITPVPGVNEILCPRNGTAFCTCIRNCVGIQNIPFWQQYTAHRCRHRMTTICFEVYWYVNFYQRSNVAARQPYIHS